VNLTLGNPIGGLILDSRKTATLTIIDNTNSVPIQFTAVSLVSADQVRLTLSTQTGRPYVLQATTNFPNWVSIQTNTATTNFLQFFDNGVLGSRQRFYRAASF